MASCVLVHHDNLSHSSTSDIVLQAEVPPNPQAERSFIEQFGLPQPLAVRVATSEESSKSEGLRKDIEGLAQASLAEPVEPSIQLRIRGHRAHDDVDAWVDANGTPMNVASADDDVNRLGERRCIGISPKRRCVRIDSTRRVIVYTNPTPLTSVASERSGSITSSPHSDATPYLDASPAAAPLTTQLDIAAAEPHPPLALAHSEMHIRVAI